ncbi:cyclophane-containing RiPP N-acetyltransferase HaaN [Actinacidiphila sp. bgisy167]|uniref:cyclophane-containing RiPP N-acetyltransferase HaaN n=1 Tax=Actinacidiphila sp. bgisy167 TaxID=3413797 RepID=UPI003D742B2E
MTIRPAEKRDVPAVAQLIEEIEQFYGSTDIQPLDERLTQVEEALFGTPPLAYALIAEDHDGALAGLAAYSFLWPAAGATHSLYLKELYVRDAHRRHGLGQQLMNELRTIAAAHPGCSRIEWTTDTTNPAARAFYKALGFDEYDGKILYRTATGSAAG